MKKLKYLFGLFFLTLLNSSAQVAVGVHYGPPVWAPAAPVTVQYYYLPDIGVYYDAGARNYIYPRRGAWIRANALPSYYRGYNLHHSRPVYLTSYRGNRPYVLYKEHKVKYKGNGKWKGKVYNNARGQKRGHHKEHHKKR